jgi:hypothetical protein
MWKEMGYTNKPAVFSQTEIPITLLVLIMIGSMVAIKNSFKAFMIAHVFIAIGFAVAGSSSYLFVAGNLSPCGG